VQLCGKLVVEVNGERLEQSLPGRRRRRPDADERGAMQRAPVTSDSLQAVGYREGTLEVEFTTGTVYQYFDVPDRVYEELMAAESKGGFFNRRIRDHFRYARVEPRG
jgi:hypothetical protein